MRPQNATLLIVAIVGTMAGQMCAQVPVKTDVIRQQLGQAQAAQGGQAQPSANKTSAQPAQPALAPAKSAQTTADKSAASLKPITAMKPATQASTSTKAADPAKASTQAKDAPSVKPATEKTASSSKPGTVQAKPATAQASAAKLTPAADKKAISAAPAAKAPAEKNVASAKPGNPGAKPAAAEAAQAKLTPAVDKKSTAATPAAAKSEAAPVPASAKVAEGGGAKRDPFSPLVGNTKESASSGTPDHLPPGKAGLTIGTMRLDGLVRGPNGMIAVVANPQERVYFLREGDRIFDGQVTRITMEAISFLQSGRDSFGNSLDHEVTRRLYANATPGEQR